MDHWLKMARKKRGELCQEQPHIVAGGDEGGILGISTAALRRFRSKRASDLVCPITGSMALRRRSSRLIIGEVPPP